MACPKETAKADEERQREKNKEKHVETLFYCLGTQVQYTYTASLKITSKESGKGYQCEHFHVIFDFY